MTALRFAILGGGYGASVYLPAIRQVAGCTAVALASRTPKPDVAIEQTADWRSLVDRKDVDAVIVALPPPLHRDAVIAFAGAGKAILCEKPAGLHSIDTQAMIDACEQGRVAHAVGFQFRFEPGLRALKSRMDDVGQVERIEVEWCVGSAAARARPWTWRNDLAHGGGIILNFACHSIDYVAWLVGTALKLAEKSEDILVPFRPASDGEPRIVTAADACDLSFTFGASGVASLRVTNMALQPSGHRIIVRGNKGTLELFHRPPFRPEDLTLDCRTSSQEEHLSGPELDMSGHGADSRIGPTAAMLRAFADKLAGNPSAPLASLYDGLVMHLALESGRNAL